LTSTATECTADPAGIDTISRARELAPELVARAAEIERRRELPEAVMAGLVERGFFRLLLPRSLGGAELLLAVFVQIVEEIAKGDASAAWCRNQASGRSVPRGAKHSLRDNNVVQAQGAQAEARLGAARAFLLGSLDEIIAALARSGRLTFDQRMTIRLASTFAIHQSMAVVDTAYHAAGATAIFTANPIERRFRDIHTISQQLQGRQEHFETVGQFPLGLDPDTLAWL
jgi:alkylation response protein AidB-like acyl-CoA dehydrogenase